MKRRKNLMTALAALVCAVCVFLNAPAEAADPVLSEAADHALSEAADPAPSEAAASAAAGKTDTDSPVQETQTAYEDLPAPESWEAVDLFTGPGSASGGFLSAQEEGKTFSGCYGNQLDGLSGELYRALVSYYVTSGKTGSFLYTIRKPTDLHIYREQWEMAEYRRVQKAEPGSEDSRAECPGRVQA